LQVKHNPNNNKLFNKPTWNTYNITLCSQTLVHVWTRCTLYTPRTHNSEHAQCPTLCGIDAAARLWRSRQYTSGRFQGWDQTEWLRNPSNEQAVDTRGGKGKQVKQEIKTSNPVRVSGVEAHHGTVLSQNLSTGNGKTRQKLFSRCWGFRPIFE